MIVGDNCLLLRPPRPVRRASLCLVALLLSTAVSAQSEDQNLSNVVERRTELLSEQHRAAVKKIIVLPGFAPATRGTSGSYEKETLGLLDGIEKGRSYGTIRTDVGGIPIGFPIRVLTVPGAILGGLIGASTRQIQNHRDRLAGRLIEASKTTLSNDALATDVFWQLHGTSGLSAKIFDLSTPIPGDTDAVLYISYSDSVIDVQKDEAVLTMSARATLRQHSSGQNLHEFDVHYEDRDTLKNWTQNDSSAAVDFANYARHYLGREIAAALYHRVPVAAQLRPAKSKSLKPVKKNVWKGVSKTAMPTLTWEMTVAPQDEQDGWAKDVATSTLR